jgi:hypothetical protein
MTTDSATSPRIVIKLEKRKEKKRKNTVKAPEEAYLAVSAPQDTRLTLAELNGRISTRHTLAGLCGGISPVGLPDEPHKTQRVTIAGLCGRISPVNLQNQPQKILGSPWQAYVAEQPCRSAESAL